MRANRAVRVIFGIIVLLLFGVYLHFHLSTTPFSHDIDARGASSAASPAEFATPALPAAAAPAEPDGAEAPVPEETPEPTPDPDSPAGRALAVGLPTPPDIDITSWEYILANPTHNIEEYVPPEITNVSSSKCPQDARIADALQAFADGCTDAGLPVYLSSGYRSYNEQSQLFSAKVSQVGREQAATIVAPPGTSEHQTGLCCDITDIYRNPKTTDLENTATFQWLNEHCAEYGFILRFPNGRINITGIMYEPWHFRYVGVEAAEYIKANDLTLEEFVAIYTGEEVPGSELFA